MFLEYYTEQFEPTSSHVFGEVGFCASNLTERCVADAHSWLGSDVALLDPSDVRILMPAMKMTEVTGYTNKRGHRYVSQRFYDRGVAYIKVLSTNSPAVTLTGRASDEREIAELSATVTILEDTDDRPQFGKSKGTWKGARWWHEGRQFTVEMAVNALRCGSNKDPCISNETLWELVSSVRYSGTGVLK